MLRRTSRGTSDPDTSSLAWLMENHGGHRTRNCGEYKLSVVDVRSEEVHGSWIVSARIPSSVLCVTLFNVALYHSTGSCTRAFCADSVTCTISLRR